MRGKILVPIDFSDVTDMVVAETIRLASSLSMDVFLLHVEANPDDFVQYSVRAPGLDDVMRQHNDYAKSELNRYKQLFVDEGLNVTTIFEVGPVTHTIIDQMEDMHPDMMIMGSHGHGALYHMLMGSVCEKVFKKAICPVMIVPSRVTAGFESDNAASSQWAKSE